MTVESNAGGARPRISVAIPRRTAVRRQHQPLAGQRTNPVQHGAIDDPVHCGPVADGGRELCQKAGRGQVNA